MPPASTRPPPARRSSRRSTRRWCSRERFDPRLTIARDREESRRASETARQPRWRLRSRAAIAHARGARVGAAGSEPRNARGEQHCDRAIYRAGGIGRGGDARGGRRSIVSRVGTSESPAHTKSLAAAAESIPRMRAMREYLAATGLRAAPDEAGARENVWQHSAIVSLETECELLRVELGPRILTGPPRSLDALEARFQKFKWTYVQCYLSAHARWREKMERLELAAADARRYFDALARLNAIAALGRPEGAHLGARVAELSARVVRCELGDAIAPETTPRCSSCGFQLGASSPQAELEEAMEEIRRALEIKLAALSQSMIARLIRIHDTRASPRRISENHASRPDRRTRAGTRRQARALSGAGVGRGREVNRDGLRPDPNLALSEERSARAEGERRVRCNAGHRSERADLLQQV